MNNFCYYAATPSFLGVCTLIHNICAAFVIKTSTKREQRKKGRKTRTRLKNTNRPRHVKVRFTVSCRIRGTLIRGGALFYYQTHVRDQTGPLRDGGPSGPILASGQVGQRRCQAPGNVVTQKRSKGEQPGEAIPNITGW